MKKYGYDLDALHNKYNCKYCTVLYGIEGSVYWNQFNAVFQCHNCGDIYLPYAEIGMNYNKVQDSGAREEFTTGSVRDTQQGKGRFDLLPFYALTRVAVHFENGAVKYGDENWRKGQNLRRYISSTLRHVAKYMLGEKDEDHLAAAAWNILCLIETEKMIEDGKLPKELNDLPQ